MNYGRQFARHAVITVGTAGITGALFYVLRVVLYKHLTTQEYGLFYTLFSFVTIVQTAITFGFDPGLVPYITRYREEGDADAMKSLVLGVMVPQGLLTAIVVIAFLAVPGSITRWLTDDPTAPALLQILALHVVFVIMFKSGQQFMLGMQAMVWRNGADLARSALCLFASMYLLRAGWGVKATAIAYTLGALAEVVVQSAAVPISFRKWLQGKFTWRPELLLEAFESGKWLTVAFGGFVLFSSIDTLVISFVRRDLSDAAAYQIALPTITILYTLMLAAGVSLLPTVRTMWIRGEHQLLVEGIQRLYGTSIGIMLPLGLVLLACTSDVIMTTLFGANILNARDAFDVLAVGGITFFIAYLNLHILAGIDKPRVAGVAVAVGLFVDIALNVPLTYWFGIRGTGLAGVLGYLVSAGIGFYGIHRKLPVRFPARNLLGAVIVSGVAGVTAFGLRQRGLIVANNPLLASLLGGLLLFVSLLALELIGLLQLRSFLNVRKKPTGQPM